MSSLSALSGNPNLVSIHAENNQLEAVDFEIDLCARLTTLSLANNKIQQLPAQVGSLQNLSEMNLASNLIQTLPTEMGQLKEKKLKELQLENNPIADSRIMRFITNGR